MTNLQRLKPAKDRRVLSGRPNQMSSREARRSQTEADGRITLQPVRRLARIFLRSAPALPFPSLRHERVSNRRAVIALHLRNTQANKCKLSALESETREGLGMELSLLSGFRGTLYEALRKSFLGNSVFLTNHIQNL